MELSHSRDASCAAGRFLQPRKSVLSRRAFGHFTLSGLLAALFPAHLLGRLRATRQPPAPQSLPKEPALSPAAEAEANHKVELLLARWGERLRPEQRSELRRLVFQLQGQLETLRAYRLENAQEPATRFRPYRHPTS